MAEVHCRAVRNRRIAYRGGVRISLHDVEERAPTSAQGGLAVAENVEGEAESRPVTDIRVGKQARRVAVQTSDERAVGRIAAPRDELADQRRRGLRASDRVYRHPGAV